MDNESKSNTQIIQSPPASFAIVEFQQRVQELLDYSQKRIIATDEDAVGAVDDLSMIALTIKAVDGRRKEYTGPLKVQTDEINATFKLVSEPLAQADRITRDKLDAYRKEQQRRHDEAEKINQDKLDLARREMELKGELAPDTNVQPVPVTPAPPKRMQAHMGSAGTSHKWEWKCVDFKLVPDDLKMLDDKKIQKALESGRSIPGIEAEWAEKTRITPKKG